MNIIDQVKQTLIQEIEKSIQQANIVESIPEIKIEIPKDTKNGDYATNIAMVLTKLAKRNPREIAQLIVDHLDTEAAHVKKIDIAGPGFINFYLDSSYLNAVIDQALELDTQFGRVAESKNKKILVEYVSANPTGDLHIGHARNAAVGDTLCNILDAAGYDVTREYYINDAGNQITNLAKSIEARYLQHLGQKAEMPADGYHGQDIKNIGADLAKKQPNLMDLSDDERLKTFRQLGVDYEMAKLKQDLADFNIHFDNWFSETSLYEKGEIKAVLERMKENGYTYEQDGATWLRTTDFKDDKDRVLIKKDGTYTYFLPDIAYHYDKFQRGNDNLINLFGADHHGYINRLKASLETFGVDSDRLEIQIMQMVRLMQDGEEVKMSKRTGNAITLREIMDEVGIDAARYFLTMRSADTHFDFDMALAKEQSQDNPVYYAQYAHARICSILRQAEAQGYQVEKGADYQTITNDKAIELLKKVAEFEPMIEGAAEARAPHRVTNYIQDLAAHFHKFYNAEKVLTEDQAKTKAHLALIDAVRITLRNALQLVGVTAPEQM
ncbi:TPA: arginine--tRNA ligase [Staphylococcus pseudintermedius]|uniref:Arginine--tRNA ligase n=1 Tax=Staphylococcus pseudintermedius TaxID=283734 RepID=A0A166MQE0_STAPS|nr:arginine--tRNA ligase [Staphylococcus pseudintermedius]ADV04834.1 Arginyl-tRNA synthetase [Staphylococcus pseudintermedius HKU10-03]ANQ89158.1 arginine--tRNA ligase [Staphylococcus pseudintermedius]ANS90542.1 Arginyl-tRNA synthetase [Staphylococcus pseudintermedius]AYG55100.1 arginine--tRNA ligase [Staphylococcus pseudintermedius]EGQ0290244.1 arginine--tRNA ligase [Staphylococcus pseudintermedius]